MMSHENAILGFVAFAKNQNSLRPYQNNKRHLQGAGLRLVPLYYKGRPIRVPRPVYLEIRYMLDFGKKIVLITTTVLQTK